MNLNVFKNYVEIKPIIRQLKIAMITDEPNEIITWFKDQYSQLHTKNVRVHNSHGMEHIYYLQYVDSNHTISILPIFYLDYYTKTMLCDYRHYLIKMEENFDLDYDDIIEVTMYLLEYVLKLKPLHTWRKKHYTNMSQNQAMINAIKN